MTDDPKAGTPPEAEIVEALAKRITEIRSVSMVELKRFLAELGVEVEGDLCIEFSRIPNVILWSGVSAGFAAIVDAMYRSDLVEIKPTTPLVYMVDGAMLNLPIAKRLPRNGYKKLRWLPVVFNPSAEARRRWGARKALPVVTGDPAGRCKT